MEIIKSFIFFFLCFKAKCFVQSAVTVSSGNFSGKPAGPRYLTEGKEKKPSEENMLDRNHDHFSGFAFSYGIS